MCMSSLRGSVSSSVHAEAACGAVALFGCFLLSSVQRARRMFYPPVPYPPLSTHHAVASYAAPPPPLAVEAVPVRFPSPPPPAPIPPSALRPSSATLLDLDLGDDRLTTLEHAPFEQPSQLAGEFAERNNAAVFSPTPPTPLAAALNLGTSSHPSALTQYPARSSPRPRPSPKAEVEHKLKQRFSSPLRASARPSPIRPPDASGPHYQSSSSSMDVDEDCGIVQSREISALEREGPGSTERRRRRADKLREAGRYVASLAPSLSTPERNLTHCSRRSLAEELLENRYSASTFSTPPSRLSASDNDLFSPAAPTNDASDTPDPTPYIGYASESSVASLRGFGSQARRADPERLDDFQRSVAESARVRGVSEVQVLRELAADEGDEAMEEAGGELQSPEVEFGRLLPPPSRKRLWREAEDALDHVKPIKRAYVSTAWKPPRRVIPGSSPFQRREKLAQSAVTAVNADGARNDVDDADSSEDELMKELDAAILAGPVLPRRMGVHPAGNRDLAEQTASSAGPQVVDSCSRDGSTDARPYHAAGTAAGGR